MGEKIPIFSPSPPVGSLAVTHLPHSLRPPNIQRVRVSVVWEDVLGGAKVQTRVFIEGYYSDPVSKHSLFIGHCHTSGLLVVVIILSLPQPAVPN